MMKRCLLFAILVLVLSSWSKSYAQNESVEPTIMAHGLRVVKSPPGEYGEMRVFDWKEGTSVGLFVNIPEGGVLRLDGANSKIVVFSDNLGKDLTQPETKDRFIHAGASFGMAPRISDDSKSISFELKVPGVPTQGATELNIEGVIAVRTATQREAFAADNVALKEGIKITAGRIPLTIKSVGASNWEGMALSIALEAKESLDDIYSIQFFDGNGEEIEASQGGTETEYVNDDVASYTWHYDLSRKVDEVKVVVTYWMDAKSISVPIDTTLSVGL